MKLRGEYTVRVSFFSGQYVYIFVAENIGSERLTVGNIIGHLLIEKSVGRCKKKRPKTLVFR